MINIKKLDYVAFSVGRILLGIYFLLPGIGKIFDFSATLSLMTLKGVPLPYLSLLIVISIQLIFSIFLMLNKYLRLSSITLFVLTILINVYIHNFWDLSGDPYQAHEIQNFYKNMGIAAGLLILATKEK
ncbi:DoxX family protein [Gammaproteobacteria bacterium]|nr:DoxX family protein [Gammaproteobacteria bacterium]